jgi:hypothetical protein
MDSHLAIQQKTLSTNQLSSCNTFMEPYGKKSQDKRFNFSPFSSLELTFLYSWWANSEITVYADPEDLESLKREYALNLVNHRYEIDWLIGLVAAQKLGLLGVKTRSINSIVINRFFRVQKLLENIR